MSDASWKILILGGYGVFGGRLAWLLAPDTRLDLILAGRSHEKALAFCASLPPGALRDGIAFDRDGDVDAQLAAIRPRLVVDASGPFQAYGGDAYKLVRAAIAIGANYMDLADASAFVEGIGAFDAAARERGVYVLAGVSSYPVLTAAVVRALAADGVRVETIRAGIAPSPFARIGLNVVRAVASYAGEPVALIRDGAPARRYGLTETMRRSIRPPGLSPLDSRLFSLVDAPDLRALPRLWPDLRTTWTGAAPVPEILHRMLIGAAWLVRLRVAPNLAPLAPLLHGALARMRWGAHRGGMFVEIEGADEAGAAVRRSWHMVAEGDDGPLIPSMAVAAIVRNALDGRAPAPGARAAAGDLELADYEAIFRSYAIRHGARDDGALANAPLYRRILGSAFDKLPPTLRSMHEVADRLVAHGEAEIERGPGLVARLIARLFSFPEAARRARTSVSFEARDGVETWIRTFAGKVMLSRQWQGEGRWEGLLCESFGPLTFGLELLVGDGRLTYVVRRWTAFGLPLPRAFAPRGDALEAESDGRFRFDVAIGAPLIGAIVRYRGWLAPE